MANVGFPSVADIDYAVLPVFGPILLTGRRVKFTALQWGTCLPFPLAAVMRILSPSGRVTRRGFWFGTILVTTLIALVEPPLASVVGLWGTILVFLPCYWAILCLMVRRCHDTGRSAIWLLTLLIPLLGFVWMVAVLFFRRSDPGSNPYGPDPHEPAPDYLVVEAVS